MAINIPKTEGLSENQIDAVETVLGCSLPSSLRAFARDHDGAEPEDNAFNVPGNQSGVRAFISLTEAAQLRAEIDGFPLTGVPVAEDDCGNYVWLRPETGEILYWDHEVEGDGVIVGNDFDAFLAALHPFDAASVKLKPGQVKHSWIRPDFKPEF